MGKRLNAVDDVSDAIGEAAVRVPLRALPITALTITGWFVLNTSPTPLEGAAWALFFSVVVGLVVNYAAVAVFALPTVYVLRLLDVDQPAVLIVAGGGFGVLLASMWPRWSNPSWLLAGFIIGAVNGLLFARALRRDSP